jgi:hypothetical protein
MATTVRAAPGSMPEASERPQEALEPPAKGERAPSTRAAVPHPAPSSAEPRSLAGETLEQELPLLRAAQEAMRAGDFDRALSLLEAHAKRFPGGALSEERRAAHAIALCRKAPGPAARVEADAFVREVPSSPLVERVAEACATGSR